MKAETHALLVLRTTLLIATPTKVVNVSFNATVEYNVGKVSPGDVITVQLVDTTSNTIIDERNYTIMYPTSTKKTYTNTY